MNKTLTSLVKAPAGVPASEHAVAVVYCCMTSLHTYSLSAYSLILSHSGLVKEINLYRSTHH